ncbi:MAG: response regulator transcription factor [Oscillospiraceae bacterium]|nr:response regulator transcription factor [Oscillospiraceae bacterium]
MSHIVIAEDDIYLREELVNTFEKAQYRVTAVADFSNTVSLIKSYSPDLLVLDINLPNSSGFEICKKIKACCTFPVLILTARDTLSDELQSLELGADDFLTKPCHPQRLLTRAARLLGTYTKIQNTVSACGLTLNTDIYKLVYKDRSMILPETEGKIIRLLIERSPEPVSRNELLSVVWGTDTYVDENILMVNMTRLRKNLDSLSINGYIRTLRGRGYCLEDK